MSEPPPTQKCTSVVTPIGVRYATLRGPRVTMIQGPKGWGEDPMERAGKRKNIRNRVPLGGT